MSLAWAPLAIVVLLLPGIFFFIGLASYERLSREIVRTGVVSEIAMATAIAIGIHTVAICLLSTTGFRLSGFIAPLTEYATMARSDLAHRIASALLPLVLYLAVCTATGFAAGYFVAVGIVSGRLRKLATHKWIYDIIDADRRNQIVTAFVMTTTVEDSVVLMYTGRVHDIFLGEDGKISYLILKNCSRYSMKLKEGELTTSKQHELFGAAQRDRPKNVWDRLIIDGSNIANVLLDSSPQIKGEAEAAVKLEAEYRASVRRRHQTFVRERSTQTRQRNQSEGPPPSS